MQEEEWRRARVAAQVVGSESPVHVAEPVAAEGVLLSAGHSDDRQPAQRIRERLGGAGRAGRGGGGGGGGCAVLGPEGFVVLGRVRG